MNAHAHIHALAGRIASNQSFVLEREADHYGRVCVVGRLIPDDVDLADEGDVIRALFAKRLCTQDFVDILDEAIAYAADIREERRC